jgi:hypothetical protein
MTPSQHDATPMMRKPRLKKKANAETWMDGMTAQSSPAQSSTTPCAALPCLNAKNAHMGWVVVWYNPPYPINNSQTLKHPLKSQSNAPSPSAHPPVTQSPSPPPSSTAHSANPAPLAPPYQRHTRASQAWSRHYSSPPSLTRGA